MRIKLFCGGTVQQVQAEIDIFFKHPADRTINEATTCVAGESGERFVVTTVLYTDRH